MDISEIKTGFMYACQTGRTRGNIDAIVVDDIVPGENGGVYGRVLRSLKEIFVKNKQVSRRIQYRIENLQQWRLQHGE